MDEPSAALTDIEVEGLFAIMRKLVSEGKSIIFISHKMREVMHISDRITVLRLGEVVGTVNCADTDSKKLASMMIGRELVVSQYEKKDCSDAEIAVELSHVDYHKESKHNGLNDMSLTVHRSGWPSSTPMASLKTAFPMCRRTATCRASSATCPSRRIWC